MVKYTKDQIRFAVDIAIGDDGHRSKEVIEILENEFEKNGKRRMKRMKMKTMSMLLPQRQFMGKRRGGRNVVPSG